jgi:uncharacterized protein
MEFKHLSLEWKADDQGVIEGYGSVFDVADNGNDIVAQGAFTRSLQSGRKVKMLLQHDASDVIGVWDQLSEDGNGLRVKGRILTSISKAREAHELVKAGALDGLSIGYRTVKSMDRGGKRVIMQADLWEVSLVTFPMNEMARIDAVKAAEMSRDEIERMLTLRAGLSRSVARKLLADGYDGIKDMRGAVDGADDLAQLLLARAAL